MTLVLKGRGKPVAKSVTRNDPGDVGWSNATVAGTRPPASWIRRIRAGGREWSESWVMAVVKSRDPGSTQAAGRGSDGADSPRDSGDGCGRR